jgi:hypothetical protein
LACDVGEDEIHCKLGVAVGCRPCVRVLQKLVIARWIIRFTAVRLVEHVVNTYPVTPVTFAKVVRGIVDSGRALIVVLLFFNVTVVSSIGRSFVLEVRFWYVCICSVVVGVVVVIGNHVVVFIGVNNVWCFVVFDGVEIVENVFVVVSDGVERVGVG